MSEKKGKISLSGLGKGSSTSSSLNQFPSFRFSPENEEIHEIMAEEPVTDYQYDSLPDSPKPGTGGDVSPLKEYLLKHKWANWEKRSLSLDLDLKGKIITAIEDKRKSIVSHFIPEESGGAISSSQSVTEHIGMVTGEENSSIPHSISNSNGNASSHSVPSNWTTGSNSSIASTSSQGGNNGKQCQSNPNSEIVELSPADEFEEIGVDYIAATADNGSEDDAFFGDLSFVIPSAELCEHVGGKAQLYQPTCLNLSMPSENSSNSLESLSLSGHSEPSDEDLHGKLPDPASSPSYEKLPGSEELQASSLVKSMFQAVMQHPFSWILVVMFCIAFIIPGGILLGIYCFFLGVLTTIVFVQSWTDSSSKDEDVIKGVYKTPAHIEVSSFSNQNLAGQPLLKELSLKLSTRSQGWMTELEGEYDPLTCNLRMTRVVFVRLDGTSLIISYPHPKFRVPKRRMWSDTQISPEIIFVRHDIYTITGAKISIAPEKLARKRAWNKKYPIRIDLPKHSVFCKVSPANTNDDNTASQESSHAAGNNSHTHSPTKEKNYHQSKKAKKDIQKEDCSDKTLHLFSRTDREKDDWFRRFKLASHTYLDESRVTDEEREDFLNENHLLRAYRDYMARVLPSLKTSDKGSKQTDKFDNVSIVAFGSGADKVTISKGQSIDKNVSSKEKDSPSSSKKSTPDKEKHKDDFSDFGIENISSIPQSPAFLNAILGRIFFDFLASSYWKEQVKSLIEKKLFYIKKPPFLGELKVAELDMGCAIPVIHRASSPVVDHQGVWVDLDLTYGGRMVVTLETHINLFKLRKTTSDDEAQGTSGTHHGHGADVTRTPEKGEAYVHPHVHTNQDPNTMMNMVFNSSNIYDSEADDSGESSESDLDADELLIEERPTQPEAMKKGRIIRFAERMASSKYMKTKVVKKVVGNLGNTPLILAIELVSLVGTLAVNIPPPPTDRIWIGFRGNPNIEMCTKPKVGDRKVSFVHVSKWIQRKLVVEFQRVMVLPNMNDISIPLMEFKLPA